MIAWLDRMLKWLAIGALGDDVSGLMPDESALNVARGGPALTISDAGDIEVR
jgi:hypothetical protein